LARVTGQQPEAVAPLRFRPAVSPHLAAELAGVTIEPRELLGAARRAAQFADVVVAEGVGGLLVPFAPDYLVRDLARDLALPVVIAARPGLGTINHSLLTVEAARSAGLQVRAVVMTPWPDDPTPLELSNRATIARAGGVEVAGLPFVSAPEPAMLAAAGAQLPIDEWLGES
jgi:dethiobiotin synthetase